MEDCKLLSNIFVINLERRPDRLEEFNQRFSGLFEFEVVTAFDGHDPKYQIPYNKGKVGITLSFMHCIQLALFRGYDHCIVIQDDLIIDDLDGAKYALNNAPENWDILKGGGWSCIEEIDTSLVNGTWKKVEHNLNAEFLVVKRSVFVSIMKKFVEFDNAMDLMMLSIQRTSNTYLASPEFSRQSDSKSEILNDFTNESNDYVPWIPFKNFEGHFIEAR